MNEEDNQTKPIQQPTLQKSMPPGRIFDVVRPGRSPVSATSRPVIVGHSPRVQDTMVGGVAQTVDEARQALLNRRGLATVTPERDVDGGVFVDLHAAEKVQPQESYQPQPSENFNDAAQTTSVDAFYQTTTTLQQPDAQLTVSDALAPDQTTQALPTDAELLSVGAVATDATSELDISKSEHPKSDKHHMPWWETMLIILFVLAFASFGVFVALSVFGIIK